MWSCSDASKIDLHPRIAPSRCPQVATSLQLAHHAGVEFRILGPLEVVEDGRTLRLGSRKQRALLALLVLHADKVVSRDRLDANGPPHAVSGQGCEGSESVNWSRSARRVYLRSDYMCGGTKGTSLVVNAMSSTGEWLSVEEVRSGAGAVVTVDHRTPQLVTVSGVAGVGKSRLSWEFEKYVDGLIERGVAVQA